VSATPIALYARIRAQAAWNLLTQSGLPVPVAAGLALLGAGTSVQFANLLGTALGNVRGGGPAAFAGAIGALLTGFQLVFAFVVVGSISIRMFDLRKAAERKIPGLRRRIRIFARNLTAREAKNYFRHAGYA
jgi:hypothetical protein